MILVSEVDEVWLDTGPFCCFCEASQLDRLASFLDGRARWVRDVRREVDWRTDREPSRKHAGLSRLRTLNFPHDRQGVVPAPEVRTNILLVQQSTQSPDDGSLNHLGEIATVLHGAHVGAPLAVIDDADGRSLARARGVPCATTRQLTIEMHLAGDLTEDQAFDVYRRVNLKHPEPCPTQIQWLTDLQELRSIVSARQT